MNSGNPQRASGMSRRVGGNPEPSRRYTAGRCRDYLRADKVKAPLITGTSVPHPNGNSNELAEGGEIVRARQKSRDTVNPLVPGSSPGGPTNIASRGIQPRPESLISVEANHGIGSSDCSVK